MRWMAFTRRAREADAAADAIQAAYFRECLDDERQQRVGELRKRQAEVTRRTEAGHLSSIGRLRSQLRSVEAEVRYLDRLIDRLDRRFATYWTARSESSCPNSWRAPLSTNNGTKSRTGHPSNLA